MHGIEEKCTRAWYERLQGREFKEVIGVDGKKFT
jgi:hypothetical protein